MKTKVRLIDNTSGKVIEGETEVRNLLHFEVQKRTRAQIYRNRKAYTRKQKHKEI